MINFVEKYKNKKLYLFIFVIIFFLCLLIYVPQRLNNNLRHYIQNINKSSGVIVKKEPEVYVFILWSGARHKEKEIINDIKKHLKIIECYDVKWDSEYVINNFLRLYNFELPAAKRKEKVDGADNFLIITVIDEKPIYKFLKTTAKYKYVNEKIFNLKNNYRNLLKSRFQVHAADDIPEVNHDLVLLLGINYNDYLKKIKNNSEWDGRIKYLHKNLIGYNGDWKSMEELLYVIKSVINCSIIRINNDSLDILTDDYIGIHYLIFCYPKSNVYSIKINKKNFKVNINKYNNNLFCNTLAKVILSKNHSAIKEASNLIFKTCLLDKKNK